MKPKYISCSKSMIALILGAVFYVGCKKDTSLTEVAPPTTLTEETSASVSALAVRSNLLFDHGFEGSNPFDENKVYKQGCCSYSVTQSNSIAHEGSSSFRAEVRGSDGSTSSGYRAELITGGYNTSNSEVWYGYSTYFQDWNAFSGGEHVVQWHPNSSDGSAELSLQTQANKFDVVRSISGTNYRQQGTLKTIVSNKWYDFVWHIKWSTGGTGLVELWIDGEKYYSFTGKNMSSSIPYFKLGINRWNMGSSNRVLYYDNLRIGGPSATYADVAPEGGSTTTPTDPTNPPTSNRGPVAIAGNPQTITLPVSAVTLQGSGTDTDGTITGYLWTKTSGNGGTIVAPNAATTNVSGLTAGTYVYNLRVTDNSGATANSAVTITVNPATTTPPPTGGGSYGTLTWSGGYNSSSEINTSQGMYNAVSTSQKIEGAASFRSEVRGSQASQSSGYRSEMQYNGTAQNPTEGVYEYDVYYENWKAVSGGGHSIQWHPNSSSGSAVLSLQNYGGKFNVVRSLNGTNYHMQGTQMTTVPNKWYKMRWEIKWSTGTDGYIRLYIDGALYYSFTGKTSSGGQYLKVGQNRWSMKSSENTIVYYDNFKIYKK